MKIDWLKIRKGLWRAGRFLVWLGLEWLLTKKPEYDDGESN